jgi:hypothetical protein
MKKLACTTLCLFLFAASATAQTERSAFITAYAAGYFTSQHPSSAFEMVGLLPGFQLTEGDNKVRGYGGSVGNVLIDGRPPTSKQETLETVLRRITPDSIARIEVVRSGAPGFDFQGFPLLANVVLKPNNAPRGQISLQDSFFRHGHMNPVATGRMTWGATDVLDITFNASRKAPDGGAGYGERDFFNGAGAATRKDHYDIRRADNVWNITGGYRQPLFGGVVRITGLYNELRMFAPLTDAEYFPIVNVTPGDDREFKADSEVGGQYNIKLWSASELETNLLRRAEVDHHFQTAFVGPEKDDSSNHTHSSETISHSVFRTQDGDISFEGILDATLNTLENTVVLFKNNVRIPLPADNVHLTEQRGEGTATVTWQAARSLTLEGGLRYEISRLKQTGASVLTKTFGYWKPRVKASYKLDKENTFRFLVEREAGQLNFNNFITSVEVKANSVNGGNKDLVPQTLWQVEMNWEHALPGGSLVLTARHQFISDTQDNIAIKGVSGNDINALGNIGYGRNTEFQASLITPLPWLWRGLTVQGNATYRFSSVKDPFTPVHRSISQNLPWQAKIALTQDLPDWNTRLGISYQWPNGPNVWRINEYRVMHIQDPQTEMYVEYKPDPVWLVRLFARNVLDTRNLQERYIYVGNRGSTPFSLLEDRRLTYGPEVGLYVQRSFGQ